MIAPVLRAGIADILGQGVGLGQFRHGPVERRIEAGDLRQPGKGFGQGPGAGYVVGLVRRLHGHERVEIGQHIAVDQHRRLVARSAQHDPVTGSDHLGIR